jgi:hypothetical protein
VAKNADFQMAIDTLPWLPPLVASSAGFLNPVSGALEHNIDSVSL